MGVIPFKHKKFLACHHDWQGSVPLFQNMPGRRSTVLITVSCNTCKAVKTLTAPTGNQIEADFIGYKFLQAHNIFNDEDD